MTLVQQSYTGQAALRDTLDIVARTQVARMSRSRYPSAKQQIALQLINSQAGQELISSTASFLAGGIETAVSTIGSSLQSLLSNTATEGSTTQNKPPPSDAVATNFTGGTPQAGVLTTSVASTGLAVSNTGATGGAQAAGQDPTSIQAAAARLGTGTPTGNADYSSLLRTAGASHKTTQMVGLLTSRELGILPIQNPTVARISDQLHQVNAWHREVSNFSGGNQDFMTTAARWYTPGLPNVAGPNGAPVPGYSTNMRSDLIDIINNGSARYTGDRNVIPNTATKYSAEQNGFQAVLGAAIAGGAAAAVTSLVSNDRAKAFSTKNLAMGALRNLSGDPAMANVLATYVGPENVRDVQNIMYNATRANPMDSYAISQVGLLAEKLAYNQQGVFRSNNPTYGGNIVWDKPTIANTDRNYVGTVLTTDVVRMSRGKPYVPSDSGSGVVTDGF